MVDWALLRALAILALGWGALFLVDLSTFDSIRDGLLNNGWGRLQAARIYHGALWAAMLVVFAAAYLAGKRE